MNMKRLIVVLILFLCYINAVGQVYTLNNLFNEYRASYDTSIHHLPYLLMGITSRLPARISMVMLNPFV